MIPFAPARPYGGRRAIHASGPLFWNNPPMRRPVGEGAAATWTLAAAAAAAYAASLGAPVFGDDRVFVEGAAVFSLPPAEFLSVLFSRDYLAATGEGTYQPLVTLFHYLAAGRPLLYRAAGIALHALNAELVRRAARRLGAAPPAALLGGLLFALFPTHPETLIVSSFKGNLLALTFSLSALLGWTRVLETGSPARLAAVFACFVLALLSKETGVLIPAWLAAWSLLIDRRRPLLARRALLGFALAAAVYLWWRFVGLGAESMPRVAWSPASLAGWYAAKLAWPFGACRERLAPSGPFWPAAAAAFAALAWSARRRPPVLFGLAIAALGVAPQVWRARFYMDSPVADRFLYASAAGLALALAALAEGRRARAALAALAAAFGVASANRNLLYRDLDALYEQTAACAPEHFKAWGVLAARRLDEGDFAGARDCAARAVALNPYYPGGLRVLSLAAGRLGDEKTARAAAARALELSR